MARTLKVPQTVPQNAPKKSYTATLSHPFVWMNRVLVNLQAIEDDTIVELDLDADGVIEQTLQLDEEEK